MFSKRLKDWEPLLMVTLPIWIIPVFSLCGICVILDALVRPLGFTDNIFKKFYNIFFPEDDHTPNGW